MLIQVPIKNDGTFLVDGADQMVFDHVDCDAASDDQDGTGVYRLEHVSGQMTFLNQRFAATWEPALIVTDGYMLLANHFNPGNQCAAIVQINGGTITVSGGNIRSETGFATAAGALISISGGSLTSDINSTFTDATVTISGNGSIEARNDVTFDGASTSLTITDAGFLDVAHLLQTTGNVGGGNEVVVTINGAPGITSLSCPWFDMLRSDLTIQSGMFRLIGIADTPNNMSNTSVTVSGGTFFCGGAVCLFGGSSLALSGGVNDVRGDNRVMNQPDFDNMDSFSFTGGKIKVKKDKLVLID